jgi:hypothetical protein
MSLGDRCDEIVRLIDETLLSVGADTGTVTDTATDTSNPGGVVIDTSAHPSGSALAGRGLHLSDRPLRLELVPSLDLALPDDRGPALEVASAPETPRPVEMVVHRPPAPSPTHTGLRRPRV